MAKLDEYMVFLTENQRQQVVQIAKEKLTTGCDPDSFYVVMFYPDISVLGDDSIQDLILSSEDSSNAFKLRDFASFSKIVFESKKPVLVDKLISKQIAAVNIAACKAILRASSKEEAATIRMDAQNKTNQLKANKQV
jgi:hypothetical protein